jgi:LDH2 family malate/lactate/ureidoglycolate dehydrogenase
VKRVRIDDLRACLARAFGALGLDHDGADALAGLLVDSELRGHGDHGTAALGLLMRLYREGALNPRPDVRVVSETDGALLLDGDRGCGPGPPMRAMEWCIERARERKGMAVAAVRDWQLLVAAPYVRRAAEEGLLAFACANYDVPVVAPPGGSTPVFGTNPLAYGLPADPPVVLDIATSVVAMQKVRVAAEEGTPLPEGLIFDQLGLPTTDARAFFDGGSLAPLGSPHVPHKGFGLALFVEALGAVLTGSERAPGIVLWALDPEAFTSRAGFQARMDALLDQVRHGEKAPGVDELVLPGERGERRRREVAAEGVVAVEQAGWQILTVACEELQVPLPAVVG